MPDCKTESGAFICNVSVCTKPSVSRIVAGISIRSNKERKGYRRKKNQANLKKLSSCIFLTFFQEGPPPLIIISPLVQLCKDGKNSVIFFIYWSVVAVLDQVGSCASLLRIQLSFYINFCNKHRVNREYFNFEYTIVEIWGKRSGKRRKCDEGRKKVANKWRCIG